MKLAIKLSIALSVIFTVTGCFLLYDVVNYATYGYSTLLNTGSAEGHVILEFYARTELAFSIVLIACSGLLYVNWILALLDDPQRQKGVKN